MRYPTSSTRPILSQYRALVWRAMSLLIRPLRSSSTRAGLRMALQGSASASMAATGRLAAVQRHLSSSSSSGSGTSKGGMPVQTMTVFGAGLMGAGIAQVAAQTGFKVVLSDVTEQALQNGLKIISKSLARVGKKERPDDVDGFTKSIMANISTTTDAVAAVSKSDLVIEAIIESIKVKRDLFKHLDEHASETCIFASNTSSLSVSDIAESCSSARQSRFAGLHFFNPVPQMKLVEIIRIPQTTDETYNALRAVTEKMNKSPVTCKDTPGFIVNRLLVPYMLEAIRMVERGDATVEDIDTAMMLGAGYPMGLLDFIGLDTTSYISQGWQEKAEKTGISADLVKPIPLLEQMVKEGKLGRKSGKGFYDYSK